MMVQLIYMLIFFFWFWKLLLFLVKHLTTYPKDFVVGAYFSLQSMNTGIIVRATLITWGKMRNWHATNSGLNVRLQNSPMKVIRSMTVTTTMAAMRTMHKITRASLKERDFRHLPTLDNSPSCEQYKYRSYIHRWVQGKYIEMHMQ